MAEQLGASAASVSRHWRKNGLKPHLVRGFKASRDPKFFEKLEDIVGQYMSSPEHALVLCCDEKSQVQALDCTSVSADSSGPRPSDNCWRRRVLTLSALCRRSR